MSARILSIDVDEKLLAERNAALRGAGYAVDGATTFAAALRQISYGNFELFVIGRSVPRSQARLLYQQVKQTSHKPVLAVHNGTPDPEVPADKLVDEREGGLGLVLAISGFIPRPAPRAAS